MLQMISIISVLFLDSYVRIVDLWSFWSKLIFRTSKNGLNHRREMFTIMWIKDTNSFVLFFETKLHRLHTSNIICRTVTFPRSRWWFFTICFKYFLIYFLFIWCISFCCGIYFYLKVKHYCSFLILFHGYFHDHLARDVRVSCAIGKYVTN